MTPPVKDNFYLLLELDPSQDDWDQIRNRIEEKKSDWSRQSNMGNAESRRLAQQCLELLPEIERALADPQTRATIAGEARRLREAQRNSMRNSMLAELDQFVRLLTEPTISAAVFRARFQRFIHALSEPVVRDRIRLADIQIENDPETNTATGAEASDALLDPSVRARIRAQLAQLKLNSLYEFLNLPPSSTTDLLRQHAERVHREILSRGVIDRDSGLRKELAGECMSVFRDAARKSAYDHALALDKLSALDKLIDFTADDGVIEDAEFDKVIRLARDRGIDEEAAHDYIKQRAAAKKWTILYRRSDIRHVKKLFAQGSHAAAQGDYAAAERYLDDCLKCWPNWPPAVAAKGQLELKRKAEEAKRRLELKREADEAKRQLDLKRQAEEDQRRQPTDLPRLYAEAMAKEREEARQQAERRLAEAKTALADRAAVRGRRVIAGILVFFAIAAITVAVAARKPSHSGTRGVTTPRAQHDTPRTAERSSRFWGTQENAPPLSLVLAREYALTELADSDPVAKDFEKRVRRLRGYFPQDNEAEIEQAVRSISFLTYKVRDIDLLYALQALENYGAAHSGQSVHVTQAAASLVNQIEESLARPAQGSQEELQAIIQQNLEAQRLEAEERNRARSDTTLISRDVMRSDGTPAYQGPTKVPVYSVNPEGYERASAPFRR